MRDAAGLDVDALVAAVSGCRLAGGVVAEREGAALLGMTAVGALIAAVPKLLRNRGSYWARESALGCAGAFLCGVGMMMGLHLAGSGRIVSAMLEGSTGAFGFVIMAWIAGCVTALLAGRRRA